MNTTQIASRMAQLHTDEHFERSERVYAARLTTGVEQILDANDAYYANLCDYRHHVLALLAKHGHEEEWMYEAAESIPERWKAGDTAVLVTNCDSDQCRFVTPTEAAIMRKFESKTDLYTQFGL